MIGKKIFNLNQLAWPIRWPTKWLIFALATLAVCFPSPAMFVRHIQHWRNPNALIEPDALSLIPMKKMLETQLQGVTNKGLIMMTVERLVYEQVPYDWDWNTWGTADYLPTVTEVIDMGREDCDGRAVVAASLLKHLGYDAKIVTDFSHVWVKTKSGELMGPGDQSAIEATGDGLKINWLGLIYLTSAVSYGVAVFPLAREMILIVVLWSLFRHHRKGFLYDVIALGMLVGALFLFRQGGQNYREPVLGLQWAGLAAFFVAVSVMVVRSMHWKVSDK